MAKQTTGARKTPNLTRNFVAKHSRVNRAAVFIDRKREAKKRGFMTGVASYEK